MELKVIVYRDALGHSAFQVWFDGLRDKRAKLNIIKRIDRLKSGNRGQSPHLRGGVSELRIWDGIGYRVYFAYSGDTILVILSGGSKDSQKADIDLAIEYWNDWQKRHRKPENS